MWVYCGNILVEGFLAAGKYFILYTVLQDYITATVSDKTLCMITFQIVFYCTFYMKHSLCWKYLGTSTVQGTKLELSTMSDVWKSNHFQITSTKELYSSAVTFTCRTIQCWNDFLNRSCINTEAKKPAKYSLDVNIIFPLTSWNSANILRIFVDKVADFLCVTWNCTETAGNHLISTTLGIENAATWMTPYWLVYSL